MIHTARFPAVRTSALGARRFISDTVVDVPDETMETAALIASELATNCVRHATSSFELRVEQLPDCIRIEVEDDGDGQPVVRSPGPHDTSGRGLQIVSALADDWGVVTKSGGTGKTVWVTIALDDPSTDGIGARRRPRDVSAAPSRRRSGGGAPGRISPVDDRRSADARWGSPRGCARPRRYRRRTDAPAACHRGDGILIPASV
ncbi:MAG: ATP-binding protein [Acidimicrobiales bacterium]